MIFLRAILFGVWNGLNIKWKLTSSQDASTKWHSVGWWYRLMFALVVVSQFLPDWAQVIVNPAFLFDWWYGIPLSLITLLVLDYWLYNAIINWYNAWKWNYLGDGKYGGFWYKAGLPICMLVMLALMSVAIVTKYFYQYAMNYNY